jgi:hypothetical protein
LGDSGNPGRIRFDDPDYVLLIETLGGTAGMVLLPGKGLKRYPFFGV